MHLFRFFILVLFSVMVSQSSFGQKFGHINSALLVQNHPGIPAANAELEAYRKSLSDPFDVKTKAFQSKYQFYMEEMQAGTLSKVSAQSRQEDLQKEQDDLNKEGQQIQSSILQKRDQVLQPILAQVDSVITVIGKEGKYTMIFDDSVNGVLLFSNPTEDLTPAVKTRIGIK
jgi:outer membrane protein